MQFFSLISNFGRGNICVAVVQNLILSNCLSNACNLSLPVFVHRNVHVKIVDYHGENNIKNKFYLFFFCMSANIIVLKLNDSS